MCATGMTQDHKNHDRIPLEVVAEHTQAQINKNLKSLETYVIELTQIKSDLEETEVKRKENEVSCRTQILARAASLMDV